MTSAITPYVDPAIEDVKRLANLVLALRNEVFIDGQDYGVIPGTGSDKDKPKPVLLLPGMEKLMRALRLRPEYVERLVIRDYDRPLFHYEYECRLVDQDTNICVSTAVGLATSHESKWRWREAKRVCPQCGGAHIYRSKYPPKKNPNATPGWYCHTKMGGCGAEFAYEDPQIIDQQTGRMENPDIFDQVNTISKIAQKRALSSAIKGAANVSEFFTVDLDDFTPFQVSAPAQHIVDATVTEEAPAKGTADKKPIAKKPAFDQASATEFVTFWFQSDEHLDYEDIKTALNVIDILKWPGESVEEAHAVVKQWCIDNPAPAEDKTA